ncbi:MAG TPA: H-NS histone family protein, partial [Rhodobacterales bacterium]|nr:H-NS histone family protein [Rhodobacterales bacterium]
TKPRKSRKAKPASDGRAKVAPKYANPANPDEKWTGRGRGPKWMQAHLEAGGSKDDYLI